MTSPNRTTVIGLFRERAHAEDAIRALRSAGFAEDQIGVAMRDQSEQRELSEATGSPVAEGAAKGVVSGGVVGGLIGLLGSLLIPGVGPIVVAGELASMLTGAAAGAATGGIVGALIGLGASEEEARHFDAGIRSGGILLTVNAGVRAAEARAILQAHQADLGPAIAREPATRADTAGLHWRGAERRVRRDLSYAGPERRQQVVI